MEISVSWIQLGVKGEKQVKSLTPRLYARKVQNEFHKEVHCQDSPLAQYWTKIEKNYKIDYKL